MILFLGTALALRGDGIGVGLRVRVGTEGGGFLEICYVGLCVETSVSMTDALRRRNDKVKVRGAGIRGLRFRKLVLETWHKPH